MSGNHGIAGVWTYDNLTTGALRTTCESSDGTARSKGPLERTLPLHSKAVILSRFVPWPSDTGAFLGSALLVGLVAEHTRETVLVAADNPFDTQPSPSDVRIVSEPASMWGRKRLAFRYLASSLPFAAQPFRTPALRRHARNELAEADLVVLDHIGACWALDLALEAKTRGARLVYNAMNVESDTRRTAISAGGLRATFARFDARRVEVAERRLLSDSDVVICVSTNDRDRLREIGTRAELVVVNPVHQSLPRFVQLSSDTPHRIVLVGSFFWRAKQENLLKFLNARTNVPESSGILVRVVGSMPAAFQRKLTKRFPDVEVTGRVDRIEDHLEDCRIGVIPEAEGGGFKLKALDYAYAGLPIFGLEAGVMGLPLTHGVSMHAFATMEDLWNGILSQISDLVVLKGLRNNALEAFESGTRVPQLAELARAMNGTTT